MHDTPIHTPIDTPIYTPITPPKSIKFELPMRIIAKKNSKQLVPVHGRYIPVTSKEYKEFAKNALDYLQFYRPKLPLKPPYTASYLIYMKGKQFADLDNMIASLNDLMEEAGLIENDRYIHQYDQPTATIPNQPAWKAIVVVRGH